MPVSSRAVDHRPRSWSGRVDARWSMAYAAGLGRADDHYLDTSRAGGVVAHPVFPVAPEWQLLVDPQARLELGLTADERARGVHAGHDLLLHQPLQPDVDITVTATVVGVERTPPGARVTVRFDAAGNDGAAQWTTWMPTLYRGVEVDGPDVVPTRPAPLPGAWPAGEEPARVVAIPLDRGAAHVYTECARIWNPIHTDVGVARRAGLPDIILHGTASLAHGVSAVLDATGAPPTAVRRLGGSFRAMVELPSTLRIEVASPTAHDGGRLVRFVVRNQAGGEAVRDGVVLLAD